MTLLDGQNLRIFATLGRLRAASINALLLNSTASSAPENHLHIQTGLFSSLNAMGYHPQRGVRRDGVTDGAPLQNTRKSSLWLVCGPCSSLCARNGLPPRHVCDAGLSQD